MRITQWRGERIHLERIIAICHHLFSRVREFSRRIRTKRPAVCIRPDAIAAFTAQEFIHRHAEHLPFDVPQRLFDRADTAKHNRAAAFSPERMVVHLAPERLYAERIPAQYDVFDEIFDHACGCSLADPVRKRRFTHTGYTGIRFELDDDGMTPADTHDVDVSAGNLRHMRCGLSINCESRKPITSRAGSRALCQIPDSRSRPSA